MFDIQNVIGCMRYVIHNNVDVMPVFVLGGYSAWHEYYNSIDKQFYNN